MSMANDGQPDYSSVIQFEPARLGHQRPDLTKGLDGGGGGGMDGIASRVAALEAKVDALANTQSDLRGDVRLAIGAGVGATVLVVGMLITGYLMLSSQANSNRQELVETIRYEVGRIVPAQPPAANPSPASSP